MLHECETRMVACNESQSAANIGKETYFAIERTDGKSFSVPISEFWSTTNQHHRVVWSKPFYPQPLGTQTFLDLLGRLRVILRHVDPNVIAAGSFSSSEVRDILQEVRRRDSYLMVMVEATWPGLTKDEYTERING